MASGFKDLLVWQKSRLLTKLIYVNTGTYPKEEIYGLVQQIRRSAISIAFNLAEGYGRFGKKEFPHFISMSFASACELENLIILSLDLNFLSQKKADALRKTCTKS